MHPIFLVSLSALALSTAPALARERDQPDQTITGREVNARGVAKTPMTDLNIGNAELPKLVVDAQAKPYHLTGLKRCSDLVAMVGEFDAISAAISICPRPKPFGLAATVRGRFSSVIPARGTWPPRVRLLHSP